MPLETRANQLGSTTERTTRATNYRSALRVAGSARFRHQRRASYVFFFLPVPSRRDPDCKSGRLISIQSFKIPQNRKSPLCDPLPCPMLRKTFNGPSVAILARPAQTHGQTRPGFAERGWPGGWAEGRKGPKKNRKKDAEKEGKKWVKKRPFLTPLFLIISIKV